MSDSSDVYFHSVPTVMKSIRRGDHAPMQGLTPSPTVMMSTRRGVCARLPGLMSSPTAMTHSQQWTNVADCLACSKQIRLRWST